MVKFSIKRAWQQPLCYAAIIKFVRQRGESLRDDTNNDCIEDYMHIQQQPVFQKQSEDDIYVLLPL